MKKSLVFVLLLTTFFPGEVFSEIDSGAFNMSYMAGGQMFDNSQNLEKDFIFGFGLSWNLTEQWTTEFMGHFGTFDYDYNDCHDEADAYAIHLDGLYHFWPDGKFVPYLAAGLGNSFIDYEKLDSDSSIFFNYGGGLKYFISESIALRSDIRHMFLFDNSDHNVALTVGLMIRLGGGDTFKPVVEERIIKTEAVEMESPQESVILQESAVPQEDTVDKWKTPGRNLQGIRVEDANDDVKVFFVADGPISDSDYFYVNDPPGYVLNFPGNWRNSGKPVIEVDNDTVKGISVEEYLDELKIVVNLKSENRLFPVKRQTRDGCLFIINKEKIKQIEDFESYERLQPAEPDPVSYIDTTKKIESKKDRDKDRYRVIRNIHLHDDLRVYILTDGPVMDSKSFYMNSPPRFVIDLPGKWKNPGHTIRDLKNKNVKNIRVGEHSDKLRIVIDLKKSMSIPPSVKKHRGGLIIELDR